MKTSDANLKEVIRLFTRLGLTAFGGPAAHIAMMDREVVQKRKWMTEDHFLDLIGATNLIPGPNSTEMTMHIGRERAGRKGLILAGMCFILPAVIITGILAYLYKEYGTLPQVVAFVYGIKPAILAILVSLMISLGRKAIRNLTMAFIGLAALIVAMLGVNDIYVLFGAGAFGIFLSLQRNKQLFNVAPLLTLTIEKSTDLNSLNSSKLFLIFLKVGAILYGSGYVLFAFLDTELVSRGLINSKILADAIAVGQFTPGPVFSPATFIGWQIGGFWGAVAATAGIFLPSFLFVGLLNPLIPGLRRSKHMSAFLDAVNVASIALILTVCFDMAKASVTDWRTIAIAAASFLINYRFRQINTAYIVIGGALLGRLLLLF